MRNIETMLNDGMLGQKSVLIALSALTTGNLNAKLKKDARPYKIEDILPLAHGYIIPELTEEEKRAQVSGNLLAFARTAPGAPKRLPHG